MAQTGSGNKSRIGQFTRMAAVVYVAQAFPFVKRDLLLLLWWIRLYSEMEIFLWNAVRPISRPISHDLHLFPLAQFSQERL